MGNKKSNIPEKSYYKSLGGVLMKKIVIVVVMTFGLLLLTGCSKEKLKENVNSSTEQVELTDENKYELTSYEYEKVFSISKLMEFYLNDEISLEVAIINLKNEIINLQYSNNNYVSLAVVETGYFVEELEKNESEIDSSVLRASKLIVDDILKGK